MKKINNTWYNEYKDQLWEIPLFGDEQLVYQLSYNDLRKLLIKYNNGIFIILEYETGPVNEWSNRQQYCFTLKELEHMLNNHSFHDTIRKILACFYRTNNIEVFNKEFYNIMIDKFHDFYTNI